MPKMKGAVAEHGVNGMHRTKNDMPEDRRRAVVEMLNNRLADALDLRDQAKQAHWNVKGPMFFELHKLFDEVAAAMTEHSDEIADRDVMGPPARRGVLAGHARHEREQAERADEVERDEGLEAVLERLRADPRPHPPARGRRTRRRPTGSRAGTGQGRWPSRTGDGPSRACPSLRASSGRSSTSRCGCLRASPSS